MLSAQSGPVEILRGISLTVKAGETLGLVGPSGSGKSSLLMLMGGLERASSGTVQALGQDLGALNEDGLARFRRGRMSVVFQNFHLIPTMTALENVAVPLELSGDPGAFAKAEAELQAMGLGRNSPIEVARAQAQQLAMSPLRPGEVALIDIEAREPLQREAV